MPPSLRLLQCSQLNTGSREHWAFLLKSNWKEERNQTVSEPRAVFSPAAFLPPEVLEKETDLGKEKVRQPGTHFCSSYKPFAMLIFSFFNFSPSSLSKTKVFVILGQCLNENTYLKDRKTDFQAN